MKVKLIIFILYLPVYIFAQINIEKFRQNQDSVGISAIISAGFSIKTGNTQYTIIDGGGRINYNKENYYTFFVFNGDYGWIDGNQFSNTALFHLRYVPRLSEFLQLEIFSQIDYDKARLLLFRDLIGSGLRFKIYTVKNYKLRIGSGFMYEHERYDLPATAKHKIRTYDVRWTNYFDNEIELQENLKLFSVVYYQPRVNEFSNTRILSENNLVVDVSRHFSFFITYDLRFDSNPPDGKKETDTKSKFGISLNF